MDADDVKALSKAGTQIIAPPSVADAKAVTPTKTLANGESTKWDKWTIEAIPMYNIVRKRDTGKPFHTSRAAATAT